MKFLSIETTTTVGSIAITENFKLLKEVVFRNEDIAAQLVKYFELVISEFDFTLKDIDYFVVSKGPGSWTGIKTGIAFVKGLVYGERKKIYAVSVPETLFFILKEFKNKLICIVNAYRGNFYISTYNGKFNYKNSFSIKEVSYKELKKIIEEEKYIPIGPGVEEIRNFSPEEKFKFPVFPLASFNAFLACEKIKRGIKSPPAEPYYGR